MQNENTVYEDGEIIFQEGSIGREIFVIKSGRVEISMRSRDRKIPLAILEKGDFLGELAVLTNVRRCATATAIGEVTLESLTMEEILSSRQLVVDLLQTLAKRLRQTDSMVRDIIASIINFLPKPD